ncbi:hypothetical protein BDP27DRAFT_1491060 [Rhodocollybia butyracea]|uniref:Uncharacterized protein n=1 Tax=Rhodocollybia butyracea TaxID=206335 RepID=A0A9P5PBM0_9AGAR|nr:hypothetical protein BDP27DRAFT_1491060 [Rhodocollybia butyracea]
MLTTMTRKIVLANAKPSPPTSNKPTSANKPSSSASKPSSKSKKRKDCVESDDKDEPSLEENGTEVDEDLDSNSSQPAKRRKGRNGNILGQLEKKAAKVGLEAFKNSARWITTSWSPSIPWHRVFQVGLESDSIIVEGCMGDLELEEQEQTELLEVYEILKYSVPSFETEISSVLEADALDELISEMSTSGSDAVSQDIRKLKNTFLDIIEAHRGVFKPPIN